MVLVVGLSHRSAPIDVRERLALSKEQGAALAKRLCGPSGCLREAAVLSTCNRVEVYAVPTSPRAGAEAVHEVRAALLAHGGEAVRPHLVHAEGEAAARHAFRVASSLDSLVVGEPQILGQLREAFDEARELGTLGPVLGELAQAALRAGRRVRSETAIGAGQVSVPSVAVDLARQIFSELAGRSVLLVGAGEMAEAAARILAKAGARITLLSRTRARADDLARELGGAAVRGLHELDAALVEADIVLSSTSSPGYVLTREHVRKAQKARRHRSLFLIDIAVPRDVEPSVHELDEVYLYDVDDLSQLVAASLESRAGEVQKADAIVERELEAFGQRARGKSAGPTIAALRERVRGALEEELARSLAGKLRHLPEADRKALGVMLDSAVNRVLHEPSMRLKRHAAEGSADALVSALGELFALDAPSDGDGGRSACEGESLPPPEMVTARVGS